MLCQFQVYSSDSVIHTHIYIFFFRFFSIIRYYNILSIVPCAIQQVLISYVFYIQYCVYVNPNLQIYPFPPLNTGKHKFIFYFCNSISVLQISSFVAFFLDSIVGNFDAHVITNPKLHEENVRNSKTNYFSTHPAISIDGFLPLSPRTVPPMKSQTQSILP